MDHVNLFTLFRSAGIDPTTSARLALVIESDFPNAPWMPKRLCQQLWTWRAKAERAATMAEREAWHRRTGDTLLQPQLFGASVRTH